jgi:hypothetical protein
MRLSTTRLCPDGVLRVRLGFEAAFGIKGQTLLETHTVLAEALVEWIIAHKSSCEEQQATARPKTREE